MKKIFLLLIILAMTVPCLANTSAFDIEWWSQKTYSNNQGNTLKQWAEGIDGRVGDNVGTGSIFYVDSGVTNEGDGSSWDNAKDTIDEAIGLCTASRGDVIYVAQGHTETEATASTSLFTLDVAGVSIIGVGNGAFNSVVSAGASTGQSMPTLILDHASATITISAVNTRISGLLIVSDITDVLVGVTIAATADGCIVDNCIIRDNGATLDMTVMLSIAAAANEVKLIGNNFIANVLAGGNNAILLVGANTNILISGNVSSGKYATGNLLGSAAAQVNATIVGNIFANADGAAALTLNTASTGMLADNYLGGKTSIATTLVGDDAMWCFNNQVSGDVAASGAVDPAADTD